MLTKETVIQEGYKITRNHRHAIYILPCGSMIDGDFYDGSRCEDHRMAEAFSEYDRYDGEKFWIDVTVNMGLIIVEPETKVILIHPEHKPTEQQQKQIRILECWKYETKDFN